MKKILLAFSCCIVAWAGHAQQRTVTGKVTDKTDNSALPGVSILIKGTAIGTTTDATGNYSIEADNDNVLTFSFIGFESFEASVGTQTTINVSMSPSVSTLEEVVVIGFGEREKKDITGSVATVQARDIEKIPFASPQFAMQGKTPGVRVVNTSGDPSEGPQIFVRGIGTWNGASQPLYVIDGQMIETPTNGNQDVIGSINLWTMVNPNDIESISVLKDASAAAIYGSRAANGVVLITTKKGKKGKPVIELNTQVGIQNIPTFDMLGTSDFIAYNREAYTNSLDPNVSLERNLYGREEANLGNRLNNFTPQFDPQSPYYFGENPQSYNWQNEIRNKNALNQNYSVRLSGANEAFDYYVSVGYNQQESVVKGNDFERYNVALNVNTKVSQYIRTGLNYKLTYQESQQNNRMLVTEAAQAPVWQPLYDETNRFGFAPVRNLEDPDAGAVKLYGAQSRINPLALMDLNMSKFNLLRNLGQAYIEVEPLKGFTIRGSLNLDYTYQQRVQFTDVLQDEFLTQGGTAASEGSFGLYGLRTNKFFNYQADLVANYGREFGKHKMNATFVIQDQRFKNWTEDFNTRNAQTRDRARLGIPGGQAPGDQSGFASLTNQKYRFSYVGRLGYNYSDKYYLDLSYRRDGSNGFPKENRWGDFYSVAAAWRLIEEGFMEGLPFISDLKLRAGWGQTGNDEAVIGSFAYLSKVSNKGSYSFGSGNGNFLGRYLVASALSDLPNRSIYWEKVTTTNVGVDAAFLNGKVTTTIEYFKRETDDILQGVDIPLSVGTGSIVQNIGSLRNSGVEVELGFNNRIGDLTYGISGNISFLKNVVTDLYNDSPISTPFGRVEEGRSIGHLWGYRLGGIFQSQAEIDAFYAATPDETNEDNLALIAPGDMYFVDVQGNPTDTEPFYSKTRDGVVNTYDETEIGKTIPGHTYGLNLDLGYKGFDLTVNFYGEGDVEKVNVARRSLEVMNGSGLNQLNTVAGRFTSDNPSSTMPRAVYNDPAGNNRFSSRWVEKAGFFRLNTWQLGYSVPSDILSRTNVISRVRIFIGGQNNMLLTKWSTLDPVNDEFPLPKSYFVGLNATL